MRLGALFRDLFGGKRRTRDEQRVRIRRRGEAAETSGDMRGSYGFGRRAHRPDPNGHYGFSNDANRWIHRPHG